MIIVLTDRAASERLDRLVEGKTSSRIDGHIFTIIDIAQSFARQVRITSRSFSLNVAFQRFVFVCDCMEFQLI